MQLAIISDLHANLPAVRAVLTDMRRGAIVEAVCLGDIVGYNAFCRETITALQQANIRSVCGNHDLMAIDQLTDLTCGPVARRAIAWTREALDDESRAYLAALPDALRLPDDILCVHAVLDDCAFADADPFQNGDVRADPAAGAEPGWRTDERPVRGRRPGTDGVIMIGDVAERAHHRALADFDEFVGIDHGVTSDVSARADHNAGTGACG